MRDKDFEKVYAVPRRTECISKELVFYINFFGNHNGFKQILDRLENEEVSKDFNMAVISHLAAMITTAVSIYHKGFIEAFGARIVKAIIGRLMNE